MAVAIFCKNVCAIWEIGITNLNELKNFTIALRVFMIVDSQIWNTSLSNFIMFHWLVVNNFQNLNVQKKYLQNVNLNFRLCLVLVFVEFSLPSAGQLLKLQLQTKLSLKQIFPQYSFADYTLFTSFQELWGYSLSKHMVKVSKSYQNNQVTSIKKLLGVPYNFTFYYEITSIYLNCQGNASPHQKLACPHRDLVSSLPPSRFQLLH